MLMAEPQQIHFDGAYYGNSQVVPSIPTHHPHEKHHHATHRRRRSCGLCCILVTLLKIFLIIIVVLGIATLVVRQVLRPSAVKFYVEKTSLAQFNLSSTNTLYYDLKLEVSINNPNKMVGIYYDELDVAAYCDEERFGWAPLPSFYQGHRNITMVYPVFSGQSVMVRSNLIVTRFSEERTKGLSSIGIMIHPNMKFKIGHLKTSKFSPKIWCDLMVPLTASSSPTGGFIRTKRDVDFF